MGNTNSSSSSSPTAASPKTQQTNAETRRVLQESWDIVKSTAGETECIRRFYVLMMERGGERVRRLFAFTDMPRQAHMISSIVKWAMGSDYSVVGLQRLGVFHAHLGVVPQDLELFANAFIDTLKQICKDQWRPEFDAAWRVVFKEISAAMSPAMDDAKNVIETVTSETAKENDLADAHRSLVQWFAEVGQGGRDAESMIYIEESSIVSEHVSYRARHADAKGFGEARPRTIELHGRLMYILKGRTTVRVIDLSLVSELEGIAPSHSEEHEGDPLMLPEYIIQLTVGKSVVHQLVLPSESKYETLLATLRRATHQFGCDSPAPTLSDLDLQSSSIFTSKQKLTFQPSDFVYMTLLGRGSFGKVVKVMHKATNKVYAMKVIHKNSFRSVRNVIEVRRERAILDQIDHPFIVKFYGVFQSEDKLYFLFDFLSGGELFHHTKNAPGHHFSEEACRFYLAEIACALEHLRMHKIIHRDIKGDNFVLDKDGHVVLTDFGFAKVLDDKRRNKSTCGTLAYIAPEVIAPTPMGYNYEVDWWSMGVVLFTMLTGFFPFLRPKPQDTAKAIVRDSLRFPPKPVLSKEAQDLCRQLLRKRPYERISTLAQLKAHPFYAGFDWDALEGRRMEPPFKPDVSGSNTKYFSKKYTQSPDTQVTDAVAEPSSSELNREKNVFSSFFFAQEAAGSVHEESDDDDDDSETLSTDGFAKNSGSGDTSKEASTVARPPPSAH